MIKINLAPEGPTESPLKIMLTPVLISLFVYAIGTYAPSYYVSIIRAEVDAVKAESATKKSQIASLQIDIDAINALENSVNESKNRSAQILNLKNGRKQAILVADKIQQLHQERMWLSSVTFDKFAVRIKGFASDHSVISDYAKQLKAVEVIAMASTVQIEDFEPNFTTTGDVGNPERPSKNAILEKTNAAKIDNETVPLKFTDLRIVKSVVTKFDGTPFNEFELEFKANAP